MQGNKVMQIHNITKTHDNKTYVIGREYLEYDDFYTYPYASSKLNIFEVKSLSQLKVWSIKEICGKCMVLPVKHLFVAIPIIHSVL